jgi:DNA-binding GntR family transcriptional regulator
VIVRRVPLRYTRAFREQDGAHGAFEAEVRAAGMTPSVQTTVSQTAGGDVIRERVMSADGVVVQLATTMIPGAVALLVPPLLREDTGAGGLMSRLAEAGHAAVSFTETIRVRTATVKEALLLGLDLPAYEITHVAYSAEVTVVEQTVCLLPCSRWTLDYTWHSA